MSKCFKSSWTVKPFQRGAGRYISSGAYSPDDEEVTYQAEGNAHGVLIQLANTVARKNYDQYNTTITMLVADFVSLPRTLSLRGLSVRPIIKLILKSLPEISIHSIEVIRCVTEIIQKRPVIGSSLHHLPRAFSLSRQNRGGRTDRWSEVASFVNQLIDWRF
jgi:hypothetical protein